jgi:N-acetylmuramoyl-L-alanine amidase
LRNGPGHKANRSVAAIVLAVLLLVTLAPFAEAQSRSMGLEEILQSTGAALMWDPWRHTGRLSRGDSVLIFRPGDPWMVLNGDELVVTGTVLEERGRLIFSPEAADTILGVFGVNSGSDDSYRLSTILIDPGHGGRDQGAGRTWPVDGVPYPLMEKDVVLEIGLRLAEALEETYPDKTVMLTRENDVYPTLEERVSLANGVELRPREGMIYISIHANASLNTAGEGFEVWYLPQDYRRKLVDPGSLGSGSDDIAPIVNALWEEEFTHESVRLADMILSGFEKALGEDVPNRGRREESWFVVRNARMASVLVEVGFVTQSSEAGRLRRPEYLSRVTEGLYNGVVDFITYFEGQER